jgi:galactokinase
VGDLVRFGALMDESCTSSIHQYQSGHRATVTLHNIMGDAPGVYGSRFSGGGHGGCVIGLAESTQAEEASEQIMNRYRQRFPEFARDAAIYWAANGEGR